MSLRKRLRMESWVLHSEGVEKEGELVESMDNTQKRVIFASIELLRYSIEQPCITQYTWCLKPCSRPPKAGKYGRKEQPYKLDLTCANRLALLLTSKVLFASLQSLRTRHKTIVGVSEHHVARPTSEVKVRDKKSRI
jgi:hypothetical protein